jgi:hypothetical protein
VRLVQNQASDDVPTPLHPVKHKVAQHRMIMVGEGHFVAETVT